MNDHTRPEIEIRSRWDNSVLYRSESANTIAMAVTEAVAAGADLTGADLTGADLTRANLTGADLTRANLTGADLTGADLTGADLTCANLTGANLTGAGGDKELVASVASVQFSGHGECGRMLTAIKGECGTVRLFCGCFVGDVAELRTYIGNGADNLKKTRSLALNTVLVLLDAKNGD